MSNPIVFVNVTQTLAPTPNRLQQTGAFISQGGTNLPMGTYGLLTQQSDLAAVQAGALTLATLTESGATATATLSSTTIASGTYNTSTGLVTLTLTAAIGVGPGNAVSISGATGTGTFSAINGFQTAIVGSTPAGTVLMFTIASGLTMTITGGNITASMGLPNSTTFLTTIAGATPTGYNGTVLATVTGAGTFTYTAPAGLTTPATGSITATPSNQAELQAMNITFWAQGSQTGVYVLELGPGTPAQGVTALSSFITNNAQFFYSYLVPRAWAAESTFITFAGGFEATNKKTYFFVTCTTTNYTGWTSGLFKDVLALVEAPGIPSTEFSLAAVFWVTLTYNPSSTNQVPPLAFAYLFGVTAYPQAGNQVLFSTLRAANVNIVGTGAEGGISNTILFWGHLMDGNPFNYWYSIDWAQINLDLDVSNEVINGSNSFNPLYYNQDGINRLQARAMATMKNAISYGLALGSLIPVEQQQTKFIAAFESGDFAGNIVVNAEPFVFYTKENPSDYKIGKYGGLTIVYTPLRGFEQIIINLNVTQFVS